MSINLIAILLSLAMMLTGAGEAGQPAEAARTLTLHNVKLSVNGDTVELAPELHLGAYTDGKTALFDLGLALKDEALMPFQLKVAESGITALAENAEVAVNVTAKALEGIMSQVAIPAANLEAQGMNNEVMAFITEEYIPAYFALLEAGQDKDFQNRIQEKADAVYAEKVDRGEGKPVTELVEGENMALTEYSYALDGAKLAELADAVYNVDPVLANYYNAMFKLYAMAPEESGLNGLTSFADLFGQTGMDMTMDVVEKISDDGEVNLTDAVLTINLNSMVAAQAKAQGVDEADIPTLSPMQVNVESVKLGDDKNTTAACDYQFDEGAVSVSVNASSAPDFDGMNMVMSVSQEDVDLFRMNVDCNLSTGSDGSKGLAMTMSGSALDQGGDFGLTLISNETPDGASTGSVSLTADANGNSFALSFDADVTTDAIEDKTEGREAIVIDDLSQEALAALGEDQAITGALLKTSGAVMADASKLTEDESVQKLVELFNSLNATEATEDGEYDYTYDMDDGGVVVLPDEELQGEDDDFEFVYEEPEDDGVLGFKEPTFSWMPEGWTMQEYEADTAYDMVNAVLGDGGENYVNLLIYEDGDNEQETYLVAADGAVSDVKDTVINVSVYEENSAYILFRHDKLLVNMMVESGKIDMDTIGKIIAGIQW